MEQSLESQIKEVIGLLSALMNIKPQPEDNHWLNTLAALRIKNGRKTQVIDEDDIKTISQIRQAIVSRLK